MRPELMRPPRRRLPVRRRSPSSTSPQEDEVDTPRGRQTMGTSGVNHDDAPPQTFRYWHSRNNGINRSYGSGMTGSNQRRYYGRPNPWGGGGGNQRWSGGYYRCVDFFSFILPLFIVF